MKGELSEAEKDLIVLNNFSTTRLSVLHGLPEAPIPTKDSSEPILVSCNISKLHVIVCDLMDLYTDSRYVNAHKLKVLHDTDLTLILSFPLLHDNEVITEHIHVSASLHVSHINTTFDFLSLERICGLLRSLSTQSKLDYEKDVVRQLNDVPTAGFFSTPSASLADAQGHGSNLTSNLVSIFNTYRPPEDAESRDSEPFVSPAESLQSLLTSPRESLSSRSSRSFRRSSSDFHSIASEDDADFHSVANSRSTASGEEDEFKSVCDDSSSLSRRVDWLSDSGSLHSSFPARDSLMHRNSVFSISSSKHTSRRSHVRDRFMSIGGDDGDEDFKSVGSAGLTHTGSLDAGGGKKRMNLNWSLFDILPIDFPMISLVNVHPFYCTIRPELVTIDMSVNVDSVSVILAENKKDKVGGGGRRET